MSKQRTTAEKRPVPLSPQALEKALAAAGKKTFLYQSPDGSAVLLLPYGARVLGLFPPQGGDNFYWVNPALGTAASARKLFATPGWQNTGGDRTWITPEIDVFFPDYPLCRRHVEPAALDAAPYALAAREGGVALSRAMTLHFARAGRPMRLRLSKWIGPAANPLRLEKSLERLSGAVAYAGYTQRTGLKLLGESARSPVPAGIWNLIQLPHGGELLVPTYARTRPRVLFGNFPPRALVAEPRCLRVAMNLRGEHKLAVRAAATTGRVGYAFRSGRAWSLVVRNFFANPSGDYVDVPKDEPADFGYAVHAVNVLSGLGDFCELEYHAPAVGQNPQCTESTDVSQVWAFRGPKTAIRTLVALLLGVKLSSVGQGGQSHFHGLRRENRDSPLGVEPSRQPGAGP
jgi:hypothetical protein